MTAIIERKKIMANALGYVNETKSGFEGVLAMMNLSAPIRIEKNDEKAADGQPDYRIFAGETATENANLAPVKGKKGRHVLLWNPN